MRRLVVDAINCDISSLSTHRDVRRRRRADDLDAYLSVQIATRGAG